MSKTRNVMGTNTVGGHEQEPDLIESLCDSGEAEEYLNAALEEDDPELVLLALRNVAETQGGEAQLVEKAKLNRESLYKILSELGNPELKSLDALLHALGFRLAVNRGGSTRKKNSCLLLPRTLP